MTFPFSSRKTLQKTPPLPPASAPPLAKVDSLGLQLATTYRVQRPSTEKVEAFKHQVGWAKLDHEGRYRVQQFLFKLVAGAGHATVKYPYREAIVADFAVSIETSSRFAQQDRDVARVPTLERDLDAANIRAQAAEERARGLRSQYEDAVEERDRLVESCASLNERAEGLERKLEDYEQRVHLLFASLPSPRAGVRAGGLRGDARQRLSVFVVPPLPEDVADDGHRVDEAATVVSASGSLSG